MTEQNPPNEEQTNKREELATILKSKGLDDEAINNLMGNINEIVKEETLTDAHVKIEEIKSNLVATIVQTIVEFIKGVNVTGLIETWGEKKKQIINAETESNVAVKGKNIEDMKSARIYLLLRYAEDVLLVSFILVAICYLAYNKDLEQQVTGTLLAAIIGYALGRFNSNPSDN